MNIEYRPIGVVHSPFSETKDAPTQPKRAKGVRGTVEIFPEFVDGLSDLEGFSHIVLLCHLHLSTGFRLKVVPYLDTEVRGVFATRSPSRPNPIGLSVVTLVEVKDNTLFVEDIDLLEGTPVIDIKPYVGELEAHNGVRRGWLDTVKERADPAKKHV